jgi:hypothetical protein
MNMKYAFWFIIGVVLVSIVTGLFLIDSPSQVRAERYDQVRVGHLQNLQGLAVECWSQKKVLPATLADLSACNSYQQNLNTLDPVTSVPYEYNVLGAQNFELCATFMTSSTANADMMYGYTVPSMVTDNISMPSVSWNHAAGHVCFERHFDVVTSTPAVDMNVPKTTLVR